MSAHKASDALAPTLFGKTRCAVLALLYGQPAESLYLRQVIRAAGAGQGAVQRELKRLTDVGVVERRVRGRHVYYQAASNCPIFAELRGLMIKTAGPRDVLRAALDPIMDSIDLAFLFGSLGRSDDGQASDVDVMVVGDVTFARLVAALAPAQETLCREINPTVYPPAELARKQRAGHHFVTAVLNGPKVFLVGDERELEGLAPKRLADRARNQPPGNRRLAGRGTA